MNDEGIKRVKRADEDSARWRPIHGDEMPEKGQKVRTWIPHYGESERIWQGNWAAEETHWRPEAKGPATERRSLGNES